MSLKCQNRTRVLTLLSGESFEYATTILTKPVLQREVWVKGEMALFDVKVFNPIAKAYLTVGEFERLILSFVYAINILIFGWNVD